MRRNPGNMRVYQIGLFVVYVYALNESASASEISHGLHKCHRGREAICDHRHLLPPGLTCVVYAACWPHISPSNTIRSLERKLHWVLIDNLQLWDSTQCTAFESWTRIDSQLRKMSIPFFLVCRVDWLGDATWDDNVGRDISLTRTWLWPPECNDMVMTW